MDYVTVRELREKSGEVWQRIEAGEEIIVTRNGKPFALLLHTEPSEVEAVLRAHRAARLGAVLQRLQAQARRSGAHRMTDKEIQAEIDAVRAERRASAKRTQPKHAGTRRGR
jgi:prevent-host-death family protein